MSPTQSRRLGLSAALLVGALMAHRAEAVAPITFTVCESDKLVFVQCGPNKPCSNTDEMYVNCPGAQDPVLIVIGCVGPKVQLTGKQYTLSCASWKQFKRVPA